MGILIRWLVLTIAVLAASYFLPGIRVSGLAVAFLAAGALGILNALLRPILIVLTLPINVLSLGLFTFVINALLLKLASLLITGFEVQGFWTAVGGSLVISIVSWLINLFIGERGRIRYVYVDRRGRKPDDNIIDMQKGPGGKWE